MSPTLFTKLSLLWSFRRELYFVSLAFIAALLLPIVAVIILANTGIDIVSERLATVNENTQAVEIRDPATGKVITTVKSAAVWPVKGIVTLEFGEIDLPYQPLHTGIDIGSPSRKVGDPVTAFLPGKVIYAGEIFWGFGKHIIIDHGDHITSVYAHLDKIFVVPGQEIKTTDQVIGNEGSTGWSTGPHLHFEIRVFGIPVNPRTFLEGGL